MAARMKVALLALILTGCGGVALDVDTDAGDAGHRRDGGHPIGRDALVPDRAPPPPDVIESELPAYQEDACPDLPPPPPDKECDPFQPHVGCPDGFACYPFPPEGEDRCHPGPYRTSCASEGTGQQGMPCGDTVGGCAAGHVCVISGQGNQ